MARTELPAVHDIVLFPQHGRRRLETMDESGTGNPSCWRCATKTPITPIAADGSCAASDANLVQLRATLC